MNLKQEILQHFMEWDFSLVEKMKNCEHAEPGKTNPYHMEGSVWTHSMMVYNQANPNSKNQLLMALCHDIGKAFTRNITKDGKVIFYGHSDVSTQYTIDFLNYLFEKNFISFNEFDSFIKYNLSAVANHIIYYKNLEKKQLFANNNPLILRNFEILAKMDTEGSICKKSKIEEKQHIKEIIDLRNFDHSNPTVHIWCGLPGSGKDYLANKLGFPIISFDDIRIEIFKQFNKVSESISDSELYDNAWNFCIEKGIDLNKYLRKKAKIHLEKGNSISICNTSLTRKSRRSIINTIGTKYNYIIEFVAVNSEKILDRNEKRTYRHVPTKVIFNMMDRINVPTLFEKNVNHVNYILNI